jgi:NADPH-dependent glutamate synthase beta subunit-like oxidoreductase
MSDTPAPKPRKEDDPDAFMTKAREQLTKQREEVEARRTAIDEELALIDGKLDRIEAYFNPHPATVEPKTRKPRATTGTRKPRKAGVRDEVLAKIAASADGISRKDLLTAMNATDKAAEQSISNAVSALKKDGKISGEQGHYKAI